MFGVGDPVYPTLPARRRVTIRVWEGDYGTPSVDPTSLILIMMCKLYKIRGKFVPAYFPFIKNIPSIEEKTTSIVDKEKLFNHMIELTKENTKFTRQQRSKIDAYKKYFMENFALPFQFDCWIHETNYAHAIDTWFTNVIPFPFSMIYLYKERSKIKRLFNEARLKMESDAFMSMKYKDAAICLGDFNYLLKDGRDFLYHNVPTSLDAVVYSYVLIAMQMPLHNPTLQKLIFHHRWLVRYINRITRQYFPNMNLKYKYVERICAPYEQIPKWYLIVYGVTVTTLMLLYAYTNNFLSFRPFYIR